MVNGDSHFIFLNLTVQKVELRRDSGLKTSERVGVLRWGYTFAFQAIQKLSAHFTNLCFAVICKFLGFFFGRDSFSQRISKIWRNKKY